MKKVLIVEDDLTLADGIELTLVGNNISILKSNSVNDAKNKFETHKFDLVILDNNIAAGNNYDFLLWLSCRSNTHVLILTSNDIETMAFEHGAVDCLAKPFSLAVLRKRVTALLRSSEVMQKEIFEIDSYIFDFENAEYSKAGEKLVLSMSEQKLLKMLVNNRGELITRDMLAECVWGTESKLMEENALSVIMRRLRSKLGEGEGEISYIQTVYGKGYVWKKRQR